MKIMVTSFKRSQAHTTTPSAPNPAAGRCQPTPLLETPGHSWASLGQSLVESLCLSLGPSAHKVLFPQESVSPVLCTSGGSVEGVNGDLLQEGLCRVQVCCTRSSCPCGRPLLTCTSAGDTQTLKGRSGSVSVESPGAHKVLFEPSEHLWQV